VSKSEASLVRISQKTHFDTFLILIFSILYTKTFVTSLSLSLGLTSLEDGPIMPSLVYKNPEIYANDFRALEIQHLMWTSSTKWVPALLCKWTNLNPAIFHFSFVYLQSALTFIGIFKLSQSILHSRYFSWIILGIAVISKPHFVNAGWYGDLQFMPYTTWIALGPILISWSLLRSGKINRGLVFAFIATSIHPAMGLTGLVLVFFCEYINDTSQLFARKKVILLHVFAVAIPSAFSALAIRLSMAENIPSWWLTEVRKSLHFGAWRLLPDIDSFAVTSNWLIQFLTLLILLVFFLRLFDLKTAKLTLLSCAAIIFCLVIQAVAYTLNIFTLYSISFARITLLTQIVFLIINVLIAKKLLEQEFSFGKRCLALLIFTMAIYPSSLMCIIVSLAVIVLSSENQKMEILKSISLLVISVVLYFAALTSNYFDFPTWNQFISGGGEGSATVIGQGFSKKLNYWWPLLLVMLVILSTVGAKLSSRRLMKSLPHFLILGVIGTLMAQTYIGVVRDRENRDWISTQQWARENSKADEGFLVDVGLNVYDSWGTLSQRPRVISNSKAGYAYFYSEEDNEFNRRLNKVARNTSLNSTGYILKLQAEFKFTYVVTKKPSESLYLNLCYRNYSYSIYTIKEKC
jgi:hypothetical protein